MNDFDEEDYTGCTITCTSWVQDEAFFTAVLVDKVARGGWGQIYLAQVKSGPAEGDFVAVKVITTGSTFTLSKVDELLQRLFNVEASCLVALSGCHEVAQLLATSEIQKYGYTRYCLVLEWMPCGDAQMLLERSGQGLSYEAAGSILVSVLRALAAAHELGYIHRDVKASNILLGTEGNVQLADWGICGILPRPADKEVAVGAVQADGHGVTPEAASGSFTAVPVPASTNEQQQEPPEPGTSSSTAAHQQASHTHPAGLKAPAGAPMGTPFWAAPELDAGAPHDTSVDIWSFGITFVELVTGTSPYYDTSPEGLQALTDPAIGFIPDGLPEEVLCWLRPCLGVEPDSRPTASELLQQPFFCRMADMVEQYAHASSSDGSTGEQTVPRPPWLLMAHGTAGYCRQDSSANGTDSSGWGALPLVDPNDPLHMQASAGLLADADYLQDDNPYPHFDPEVVAELRQLQLLDPVSRTRHHSS